MAGIAAVEVVGGWKETEKGGGAEESKGEKIKEEKIARKLGILNEDSFFFHLT